MILSIIPNLNVITCFSEFVSSLEKLVDSNMLYSFNDWYFCHVYLFGNCYNFNWGEINH